ncbi:hypothetical protein PsYK624_123890 [Phanerochaete sordida]|uniref:DUF6533 domain-containing protein n=1 Tax=Phanerochaete sordida TaxID=48140 RepID=A0A9P3GK08_9APHY|nr:hypothetical protein PsYK624_123890 [Phanerochaete sordida]
MFQTSSTTVLNNPHTWAGEAEVQNYISAALAALALGEHLITIDKEVRYMWRRKPSVAAALFTSNRYGVLFYSILALTTSFVKGLPVCTAITRTTETMIILLMVIFGACSALRAYALWNKTLGLFFVVFALHLGQISVNIFLFRSSTPTNTPIAVASCLSHLHLGRQQQMCGSRGKSFSDVC